MQPDNVIRLCRECASHRALPDSSMCRDCLDGFLRETRPTFLKEPAWRVWTREHSSGKDLTRAA